MKFTCSVDIDRPRDKVVELFKNPDLLKEWQPAFVGKEQVSGAPWQVGSTAKVMFRGRKQHLVEMVETIQSAHLPDEVTMLYEHVHMTNTMRNRFTALAPGKTRWESEIAYTKFNILLPKIMAFLMPGMFRKQTQKWLDGFKAAAEKHIPA
jgi:hypothetical protein